MKLYVSYFFGGDSGGFGFGSMVLNATKEPSGPNDVSRLRSKIHKLSHENDPKFPKGADISIVGWKVLTGEDNTAWYE